MALSENTSHPILLFDGICNLCNRTVQWIIENDPKGIIHFASLQSDFAQQMLNKTDLGSEPLASVVLIAGKAFYTQSEAIIRVLRLIKPEGLYYHFISFFPKPLRDWGYKQIAKNRYRIFGKKDYCMIPRAEWKERFLT